MSASGHHILWSFRRCPYAMRARLALHVSQIPYEHRELVLRDKPAPMLEASPKGTVPVIVTQSGDVVDESLDVMLWALDQNDPEHWLSPQSGTKDDMLTLISRNDGDFKHHLDRYKYATRYEGAVSEEHRGEGSKFLANLNDRLQGQDWLFGSRPNLADYAIAPFIRQFANTDRDWFDAQALPNLQKWLARILESPRFKTIMKKYPLWNDDPTPIFINQE